MDSLGIGKNDEQFLLVNFFTWGIMQLKGYGYTKLDSPVPIRTLKQLGPRLALGWMNIQGLVVDAVTTNIVKSQKRRNGA